MRLKMTDEDVVRRFHGVVGVGYVSGPHVTQHKPYWEWSCTKKADVALVISMFWPWLGERRRAQAVGDPVDCARCLRE